MQMSCQFQTIKHELLEEATIRNFLIVRSEGSRQVNRDLNESEMAQLQRLNRFIEATDREVLQDAGKATRLLYLKEGTARVFATKTLTPPCKFTLTLNFFAGICPF